MSAVRFCEDKDPTSDKKSTSPQQCRAARALIGMGQNTLAADASVSRGVIIDFENGKRTPGKNNLAAVRSAFERAGVEFFTESVAGAFGVKTRRKQAELLLDAVGHRQLVLFDLTGLRSGRIYGNPLFVSEAFAVTKGGGSVTLRPAGVGSFPVHIQSHQADGSAVFSVR